MEHVSVKNQATCVATTIILGCLGVWEQDSHVHATNSFMRGLDFLGLSGSDGDTILECEHKDVLNRLLESQEFMMMMMGPNTVAVR